MQKISDKHTRSVCSENSYCWKYAVCQRSREPTGREDRVYKAVATEILGLCPGAKVTLLG